MKSIGLLLVVVIGLARGGIVPEIFMKAEDFECPTAGGAFPHPDFCEYYYLCSENIAKLLKCPDDQLFDLVYDGCNFPELVDCGDRPTPSPLPGTTGNPGEFDCPTPGGAFPHPEFCGLYYECVMGHAELKKCPLDQGFDLTYDGCNWYYLMDCADREEGYGDGSTINPPVTTTKPPGTEPTGETDPTDSPPVTTTGNPSEFECPAADGLYANPDDCSTYYSCSNHIPILSLCPDDLLFDTVITVCNHAHLVDCGDRPIPE